MNIKNYLFYDFIICLLHILYIFGSSVKTLLFYPFFRSLKIS
jgi:hypothetical protein